MDHERRGLRQNAERQCHRLDAIDRHRGGDHLVAEHELALHVGRPGELVEWNVVLRVVPQLEAVVDEPSEHLLSPRHARERLSVDVERPGEHRSNSAPR
jgi:hypothetical protein